MPTTSDAKLEQSMEDATVALINSDPELRDKLRVLTNEVVDKYLVVIRWGSPADRLAAMKAIVPGLLRAMGRVEQSESDKLMRDAYDRMMEKMAGAASVDK